MLNHWHQSCFTNLSEVTLQDGYEMSEGEYYLGISKTADPNCPRLVLGFKLDGEKVEIYQNREAYIVVNTKTDKYLMCLGWKHAHYVFEECVRALAPAGRA